MFIPSDLCLCDPTYLTEAALGLTQGANGVQECATSAGVSFCVAFHSIAAVVFSLFLLSSLFQVVRFWFVPSDKLATNINLLYAAFALICTGLSPLLLLFFLLFLQPFFLSSLWKKTKTDALFPFLFCLLDVLDDDDSVVVCLLLDDV
jgi:hypothetical protein